ncbi:MAG: holo-ACP synthase [Treponema sp.]|jgi:holo-[acyl-carrier protein] synthase|nr:holo-ACP synthase [Treponema sp.]
MIYGIGVDIVSVSRFERWNRQPGLIERFFHSEDLMFARSAGTDFSRVLASRFAVKEAFAKALGSGFAGISLKDITVRREQNGKPFIVLFESALRVFEKSGAQTVHLSLSHEKEYAIAFVILEYPIKRENSP